MTPRVRQPLTVFGTDARLIAKRHEGQERLTGDPIAHDRASAR